MQPTEGRVVSRCVCVRAKCRKEEPQCNRVFTRLFRQLWVHSSQPQCVSSIRLHTSGRAAAICQPPLSGTHGKMRQYAARSHAACWWGDAPGPGSWIAHCSSTCAVWPASRDNASQYSMFIDLAMCTCDACCHEGLQSCLWQFQPAWPL